jgi:hypothetical protein
MTDRQRHHLKVLLTFLGVSIGLVISLTAMDVLWAINDGSSNDNVDVGRTIISSVPEALLWSAICAAVVAVKPHRKEFTFERWLKGEKFDPEKDY